MKPIYFPFSILTEARAQFLHRLFGEPVLIYGPSMDAVPESMKPLAEKGLVSFRFPEIGDERELAGLMRQYRAWADNHQGGGLALFKAMGSAQPFFGDAQPSKIRGDIMRRSRRGEPEETIGPLMQARLFLLFSQERILQDQAIAREMAAVERKRLRLFDQLTGGRLENDSIPVPDQLPSESMGPGIHVTRAQVWAWRQLWRHRPEASPVLITDSPAAWELLQELVPVYGQPGTPVGRWAGDGTASGDSVPADSFRHWIASLCETGSSVAAGDGSRPEAIPPIASGTSLCLRFFTTPTYGNSLFFPEAGSAMAGEAEMQECEPSFPFLPIGLLSTSST